MSTPVAGLRRRGRGESVGTDMILVQPSQSVEGVSANAEPIGRDSVEPRENVSCVASRHSRLDRVSPHRRSKRGPRPIFLLRRASLARYSSRSCFVFGFLRSRRLPVCSSFSLPVSATTWAKCPSCKRNISTRLRRRGKKSIRECRRRLFRPRQRTFSRSSSPNEPASNPNGKQSYGQK
jgi:hypothetical protein